MSFPDGSFRDQNDLSDFHFDRTSDGECGEHDVPFLWIVSIDRLVSSLSLLFTFSAENDQNEEKRNRSALVIINENNKNERSRLQSTQQTNEDN